MKAITETLKKLIAEHGIDIIHQNQRLKAILADLLPEEKKIRFLIELSLKAEITKKLINIQNSPVVEYNAHIINLKQYFQSEFSIDSVATEKLFDLWLKIIPRKVTSTLDFIESKFESDDTYKIVSIGEVYHPSDWVAGRYGYRNSSGQMITLYKYNNAKSFSEGLACVYMDNKYGFINRRGEEVIPLMYDNAESFQNGLALVRLNRKYGFINRNGDSVIPIKFDNANRFCEGLASVKIEGKYGFINQKGETVLGFNYYGASNFQNGLASVCLTQDYPSVYYVIDKSGKINNNFRNLQNPISFDEGMAIIRESRGFTCVDLNGKVLFTRGYQSFRSFKEGRMLVGVSLMFSSDNEWTYLNAYGNPINSTKYSDARDFNEGLACVKSNGLWGFIDKNGSQVLPFIYSDVRYPGVLNGEICVSLRLDNKPFNSISKYGLINKLGKVIIPFEYDKEFKFCEGFACVCQNKKYGFINRSGHLVIPCIYDYRAEFANGLANVRLNGKWGCIDKTGVWIEDLVY
ncbi:MAG: KWG Leptospira repeat protein [Bacteroidetes bacterium]|nr:MAG: KWG Leptospira repeat protein [Bacteroidota bacterium]